jgi:3'5'-cyclic nucleotide phosphodiesterase
MDFQDKHGAMTTLHDHTYGITSDPLTQFSCVLSALIHDVCHSGVTNAQLIKEKSTLASKYNNQSIAEQFSLDVSWKLLMEPDFANLRAAIYQDETEMKRFR